MKKILNSLTKAIAFSFILFFTVSCSDDNKNDSSTDNQVSFEELPSTAQVFLRNHFEGENVDGIVINPEGYYDVSVRNYKIDFDKDGSWKKIETKNNQSLPADILALIPMPITEYIIQNYSGKEIKKIKKKDYGYKVELTGKPDTELEFNSDGDIIKIDEDNDDENIAFESLPNTAKEFVNSHFSTLKIKEIKKDKKSYEVEFTDKTEIEFDLTGQWLKIEAGKESKLPQSITSLLPEKAISYLSSAYSGSNIKEIEKKNGAYEVKLDKNIEITFDKNGDLWSISENDDDKNQNLNEVEIQNLPKAIQTFITSHFSNTKLLYANKTNKEYKIGLTDGTRIDFDLNGEVQSISSQRNGGIPTSAIKTEISDYISKEYPNKNIVSYIKQFRGYMVLLSGYPVSKVFFDLNGNFARAY